ncbi:hypothetical protein [Streptomyces sp. NPDC102264]|uniref:hypothetical protein n=1 Tax=Streptomyces sp. NPDC102264 TaxID=3366149 RepID=UPI0038061486
MISLTDTPGEIQRDETDNALGTQSVVALHRLVRHLTADGDRRAMRADRRARRTLGQMSPGSTVRPRLVYMGSAVLATWACPNCGCLNPDGHVSCGFC